ncbi:MAG: YafY family protein [Pseudomonadota bacterium]|nr:YafY family protein [Pseudomonadota bacterium]
MDRTERFQVMDRLLNTHTVVSAARFVEAMEVSRSTVIRDIGYMRDRLNAPIIWDRSQRGYRYEEQEEGEGMPKFSLPGLWLNESELYALLGMESLLANIQPGLLEPHLAPLKKRIRELLKSSGYPAADIVDKVKVLHFAARPVLRKHFPMIMTALLEEKRVRIDHYNRGSDQKTIREISPQRLIYYRDNWYLDAFCHLRDDLRCFSLDAITDAGLLPEKVKKVNIEHLDKVFGTAYGIFTGIQTQNAVLRFSPQSARWVAAEEWHPKQQGCINPDGTYILRLPYENDTELIMDILRYGPEVEVLGPEFLRRKIKKRLKESLEKYEEK